MDDFLKWLSDLANECITDTQLNIVCGAIALARAYKVKDDGDNNVILTYLKLATDRIKEEY